MSDSPDRVLVRAKALAMARGIDQMSENRQAKLVSQDLGEDYNRLRELAQTCRPELEPYLPPKVAIIPYGRSRRMVAACLHDVLMNYCLQIAELLDAD